MTKEFNNKKIVLFIISTLILLIIITFTYRSKAEAGTGSLDQASKFERVLIVDGDTLDGLVSEYSTRYSYMTKEQYMSDVIRLNNLQTDYIYAGDYLYFPIYK